MTGDDRAGCVDQDRIEKSKAFDRPSNLLDLALGMGARVVLMRSKRLEISEFRRGQCNGGIDSLSLDRHGAIPIHLNAPLVAALKKPESRSLSNTNSRVLSAI